MSLLLLFPGSGGGGGGGGGTGTPIGLLLTLTQTTGGAGSGTPIGLLLTLTQIASIPLTNVIIDSGGRLEFLASQTRDVRFQDQSLISVLRDTRIHGETISSVARNIVSAIESTSSLSINRRFIVEELISVARNYRAGLEEISSIVQDKRFNDESLVSARRDYRIQDEELSSVAANSRANIQYISSLLRDSRLADEALRSVINDRRTTDEIVSSLVANKVTQEEIISIINLVTAGRINYDTISQVKHDKRLTSESLLSSLINIRSHLEDAAGIIQDASYRIENVSSSQKDSPVNSEQTAKTVYNQNALAESISNTLLNIKSSTESLSGNIVDKRSIVESISSTQSDTRTGAEYNTFVIYDRPSGNIEFLVRSHTNVAVGLEVQTAVRHDEHGSAEIGAKLLRDIVSLLESVESSDILFTDPNFITTALARTLITAGSTRTFVVIAGKPHMPEGNNFSPLDHTEIVTATFDFAPWLASGETLTAISSVTCEAAFGIDANAENRLIGIPQLGFSPSTGAAASAVLQQFGGMISGVTYKITVTVTTNHSQTFTLWSYEACIS